MLNCHTHNYSTHTSAKKKTKHYRSQLQFYEAQVQECILADAPNYAEGLGRGTGSSVWIPRPVL